MEVVKNSEANYYDGIGSYLVYLRHRVKFHRFKEPYTGTECYIVALCDHLSLSIIWSSASDDIKLDNKHTTANCHCDRDNRNIYPRKFKTPHRYFFLLEDVPPHNAS
jgi:hypothetical protein